MLRRSPPVVSLALTLAFAMLVGCAAPGRQVVRRSELPEAAVHGFLEALRLSESGADAAALVALEPALGVEPWHVPSHQLHQDALRSLGREDEARRWYAEAAAALPDDPVRRLLLARLETDAAAQLRAYERAATDLPASPWPRVALSYHLVRSAAAARRRADDLSRRGRLDEAGAERAAADASLVRAEELALAVTAEHPTLSAAHAALADVLLERSSSAPGVQRLADASAAARRAVALDPGSPAAHERLARCLRLRSDDEGAADSLRRSLELGGPRAPRLALLGRVLLDLQRPSDARSALEEAVALDPGTASAWINLGVACFRLEAWEAAEEAFGEAAHHAPTSPLPWEGVALTRARSGDREGAAAAMRRYLELGGQDRERGADFIDRMGTEAP